MYMIARQHACIKCVPHMMAMQKTTVWVMIRMGIIDVQHYNKSIRTQVRCNIAIFLVRDNVMIKSKGCNLGAHGFEIEDLRTDPPTSLQT